MLLDCLPPLAWFGLLALLGLFDANAAQTGAFGRYTWPAPHWFGLAIYAAAGGLAHLLFLRAFTVAPATVLAPYLLSKAALVPLIFMSLGTHRLFYGAYFAPTLDYERVIDMMLDGVGFFVRPEISALVLLALLAANYWLERQLANDATTAKSRERDRSP
jgi:hypothetical protein